MGIAKHDDEGRMLTLEFEQFTLISVYTPNAGEGLKRLSYRVEQWDKDFIEYVKNLRSSGQKVIVSGDLNVAPTELDLWDPVGRGRSPGYTPEERESFASFLKDGFIDTFRHLHPSERAYSWWTYRPGLRPTKGWRLDFFLIHKEELEYIIDSKIHNQYLGSDHCPIELQVNVGHKNEENKEASEKIIEIESNKKVRAKSTACRKSKDL